MARFVSRHRNFYLCARNGVTEDFATGKQRVLTTQLECQWAPKGLTERDIEIASRALRFSGLPEDKETGRTVSARRCLSLLDTENEKRTLGWSDEDHELVLEFLRSHNDNGVAFIEVEPVKLKAPWPGYDRLSDPAKIVELALETGCDLESVLAYERQEKDRKKVVDALIEARDGIAVDENPEDVEEDDEVVIEAS